MSLISQCVDVKDTLDFFRPMGLYLKPISRINVSVQLPQLKKSGAKISNWEVMEKVKEMAKPLSFPVFKVAKSSLEFIRFEAEIENYGSMTTAMTKLDMKTIKLSGFTEVLKVRAAEAKPPFPSRHDWDDFFRNNKDMNEMKPGERPDTIHVQAVPTKWFLDAQDRSGAYKDRPSEYVVKKVFGTFGEIRCVDIPMLDPYRQKMKSSISGIQTFSYGQELVFDVYILYKEYIGFVKAMNTLKGMKLLHKDRYEDKSWVANIKVDFDKSKHLAESTIKKREKEREKLIQKEREKDEAEKRRSDLDELKRAGELRRMAEEDRDLERQKAQKNAVKAARRAEREVKRRKLRKTRTEEEEIAERIAAEERMLVLAQRKLESIRMLDELLERVKKLKAKGSVKTLEKDLLKTAAKEAKDGLVGKAASSMLTMSYKDADEKDLRDKLVTKLKQKAADKMAHCDKRLKKKREKRRRLHELDDDDDDRSGDENEDTENDERLDKDEKDGLVKEMTEIGRMHNSTHVSVKIEPVLQAADTDEDNNNPDDENGSDEDLRLTDSTDDDKKHKDKKDRKKEKEERKKKEKEARRKKRELDNAINLATKISKRDERSRSRERRVDMPAGERSSRRRERSSSASPRGSRMGGMHADRTSRRSGSRGRRSRSRGRRSRSHGRRSRGRRSRSSSYGSDEYPDYRRRLQEQERMQRESKMERENLERARRLAEEKQERKMKDAQALKAAELAQEEMYERMVNPFLYGVEGRRSFRKVDPGQHYEQVQKGELDDMIAEKEKMERMRERELERRAKDRDRGVYSSRDDRGRRGDDRDGGRDDRGFFERRRADRMMGQYVDARFEGNKYTGRH